MRLDLTDEQRQVRDLCRDFAARDLIPNARRWDEAHHFPAPYARGEKMGCFALTEPMSGSDAAEMRTSATPRGGDYVLSGTKNFITNGPQADTVLCFAITDREKAHKGISAFLVPTDAKG